MTCRRRARRLFPFSKRSAPDRDRITQANARRKRSRRDLVGGNPIRLSRGVDGHARSIQNFPCPERITEQEPPSRRTEAASAPVQQGKTGALSLPPKAASDFSSPHYTAGYNTKSNLKPSISCSSRPC